ncbi:MAG: ArsR/SmtB family transcription factor [Sumerlaeia bacterium]
MKDLDHPKAEEISLTAVLHALSDPVRLRIVAMAAQHDELPCQAFLDSIAKSTASHHWKVLRESGVIFQRMEGTKKLNSLRRAELDQRFPGLLVSVLNSIENAKSI